MTRQSAGSRSKQERSEGQRPLAGPTSRNDSYARIYTAVKKIPHGKVATYGQIAGLAGIPRHVRQVGYALHTLSDNSGVPWQRVINAKGEVSPRTWSENHLLQRILLEDEGVEFDEHGRVDLIRFGWAPNLT
ncbi:MAG: MGMT family protein [Burkholderiales bacterium]|nr:MGMT family protein [Burkholderiales bacterium]